MSAIVAYNYDGKKVNGNDQVTIMGLVNSITGSAPSTATVSITTPFGDTVNVQANDCYAAEHTSGAAQSKSGKLFTTNNEIVATGVVTNITGGVSGQGAQLTVTLDGSGLSVTVSAGSVRSSGG